jgi:YidC/Oxa1 family membrane protein insertase
VDQQNLRLILFMVAAFTILVVYQGLFAPKETQPPAGGQALVGTPAFVPTRSPASLKPSPSKPGAVAPVPRVARDIGQASVTVATSLYEAVLTNEGAFIQSYELKKYQNRRTKKPLNLVNQEADSPRPLEVSFAPAGDLSALRWDLPGGGRLLSVKDGEKAEVVFRAQSNGMVFEKTVQFVGGRYDLVTSVSVRCVGRTGIPASALLVEGPSDLGHEEFAGSATGQYGLRTATLIGESLETEKPKKKQESKEYASSVVWTGLADQFYLSALIPDPASGAASARVLRDRHLQIISPDGKSTLADPKTWVARPQLSFASPPLATGESMTRRFTLYLGPQELEKLKALGIKLEKSLDLGWFEFISFYLLVILKWFYSWCRNWGLAVILLSILVKLVLWWPTHSSYKHMSVNQKKMQEIQPKLEAIKKKYAGDMTKQNEETMKLYKQADINLTSGCLPMLLQIPVFIALYSALSHAIELRGAPFVLWIQDLSLPDPFYILPLLMGGSMFAQQKLSAQVAPPGSAGQQKLMLWLFPIMLTVMSFQWPSGLLLYWVVTNLLSIWQQRMVNRSIKKVG